MTEDKDGLVARQQLMTDAMGHVSRCVNNMKLVTAAAKAEDQDSLSMHAADAIVNIVQLCDLYDITVMTSVFKKLSQIDRLGAEES